VLADAIDGEHGGIRLRGALIVERGGEILSGANRGGNARVPASGLSINRHVAGTARKCKNSLTAKTPRRQEQEINLAVQLLNCSAWRLGALAVIYCCF
jgi:hypothetical protein